MIKTKYKDIMMEKDFSVLNKIYDIGKQAEIIRNLAIEQMGEEGEFAKIHCSNVAQWMEEIAEQAQKALDLRLSKE